MPEPPQKKTCTGLDCSNDVDTLQCPVCQKEGIDSFFCSQDCFKRNWAQHKTTHKPSGNFLSNLFHPSAVSEPDPNTGHFDPFPRYFYTGAVRPVYPLSPKRHVPDSIRKPDYAKDGTPYSERKILGRSAVQVLTKEEQDKMRKVCKFGREVLDIAAREVKPGVTTDYIDEVVHKASLERDCYPSPLNYAKFPKSVCTSVNEVICHGIPDQRKLKDGDIINIDISLYHDGFHADLNETYYVGEKARSDPDTVRLVETSRQCLDKAIEMVKPGIAFKEFGTVIEKHATANGCSVVRSYTGHGVNSLFHTTPNIPHYARNKAVGIAKAGITFTIEPMINAGVYKDTTWPDNWTSVTADGKKSAQFEHTLLVTEDGVEVLTARVADSPGGAIAMPEKKTTNGNGTA